MRRLLAIMAVALLAAPGTWWRAPPPGPPNRTERINFVPLAVARDRVGAARLLGAWRLDSPYTGFGSFSAMVPLGNGRLLAASDTGRAIEFGEPGGPPQPVSIGWFAGRKQPNKYVVDIEAMTRDPKTGRLWVAYEGSNAIERLEPDFTGSRRAHPAGMRDWIGNTGPETMVRLSDGRFIVISEGRGGLSETGYPGLLFAGDPTDGGPATAFHLATRDGFRPVDAALLPDGRVLLLLRRLKWFPPGFASKLIVADPADIRAGQAWSGHEIATIAAPLPSENYEGLAVDEARGDGGAVDIWLISDDNLNPWQRTLLLHLRWDGSAN